MTGWRRRAGGSGAVQWVKIALTVPTSKLTGDRMETMGQGGGEPSQAAVQCNGYQSVPVTEPLPNVKVTGDRMETTGQGGSGGSTEGRWLYR